MKNNDRRLIFILLIVIFISSLILIIKITRNDKYDKKLYEEIYSEYEQITKKRTEEITNTDNVQEKTYLYSGFQGTTMKVVGEISIPKIKISYPIIYETSDEYLKIAPTKFCGPKINTVGNFCIIGHNYRNYKFFSNLEKLENGDRIFISDGDGVSMTYSVYNKYIINENDLSCTNQNTEGRIELTLITCTKNKSERLVVKCQAI